MITKWKVNFRTDLVSISFFFRLYFSSDSRGKPAAEMIKIVFMRRSLSERVIRSRKVCKHRGWRLSLSLSVDNRVTNAFSERTNFYRVRKRFCVGLKRRDYYFNWTFRVGHDWKCYVVTESLPWCDTERVSSAQHKISLRVQNLIKKLFISTVRIGNRRTFVT